MPALSPVAMGQKQDTEIVFIKEQQHQTRLVAMRLHHNLLGASTNLAMVSLSLLFKNILIILMWSTLRLDSYSHTGTVL